MGIFSAIGSLISGIFGGGSNSETEQLQAYATADDKRDKTQSYLIYASLLIGFSALMVAIFKK